MNNSQVIEDIIKASEEEYQLKITLVNKEKYTGFLQRQLTTHPEYNPNPQKRPCAKYSHRPYFNLMVDKLLLFACLIWEKKIKVGVHETRILGYLLNPKLLQTSKLFPFV